MFGYLCPCSNAVRRLHRDHISYDNDNELIASEYGSSFQPLILLYISSWFFLLLPNYSVRWFSAAFEYSFYMWWKIYVFFLICSCVLFRSVWGMSFIYWNSGRRIYILEKRVRTMLGFFCRRGLMFISLHLRIWLLILDLLFFYNHA